MLQKIDVFAAIGWARQRGRPRVHREARAQHSCAGVHIDVGTAVVEVLDSYPEHQLDSPARRGQALECDLIEALTGNSAIGNRWRRPQHLDRAVAGAPSIPAMGDCGLERVWHEIEETPGAVRTAEAFAWVDEQDPRVVRQARVEQGHRERES